MAVSRAMRRLLRIRSLEEEQRHLALESALGELNRLEAALTASRERGRRGRSLVQSSVQTGQLPDRLAGLEETRSAGRQSEVLGERIVAKQDEVTARRQEFLLKRVERRQAETLIEEAEARDATVAERRGQQALDAWFGSRLYREGSDAGEVKPRAAAPVSEGSERIGAAPGQASSAERES
jgi:hypothetical protein